MLNKKTVKEYALITVGTAIVTAAVYFFMIPGNLTPGSAAAVALLLSNVIPLPISAITFVLNVVLLIIGFIFIGKEFIGTTAANPTPGYEYSKLTDGIIDRNNAGNGRFSSNWKKPIDQDFKKRKK